MPTKILVNILGSKMQVQYRLKSKYMGSITSSDSCNIKTVILLRFVLRLL